MEELLFEEFLLIQITLGCCFFGFVTILWGIWSDRYNLVRWGLVGLLIAGISGIPQYYQGSDIITAMKQFNFEESAVNAYEADYYTTLIVTFFLGIISIMSLIMQRALQKIPRIFMYPVLGYTLLVIIYLGWRTLK